MMDSSNQSAGQQPKHWQNIVVFIALILTLVAGASFRLVGVNWDENQHMHPDERFLSLVWNVIVPVDNLGDYFNTETSTLNPANQGYGFFVYGTLPLFMVRYLGQALGQTGYDTITLLGRQVSAIFDVMTVLLVFAIGLRLANKWVGLLGAAFLCLCSAADSTFAFCHSGYRHQHLCLSRNMGCHLGLDPKRT